MRHNQSAAQRAAATELKLPDGALHLPSRNAVLFPASCASRPRPPAISCRRASRRARRQTYRRTAQNDASIDTPGPEHLHRVGTVAEILRYVTTQDGTHHLVARGTRRFHISEFVPGYPFLVARIDEIGEAEVI